MKNFTYGLMAAAVVTGVLGLLSKFSMQLIGGVGWRGYLGATCLLLLFSANLALAELLNKK